MKKLDPACASHKAQTQGHGCCKVQKDNREDDGGGKESEHCESDMRRYTV